MYLTGIGDPGVTTTGTTHAKEIGTPKDVLKFIDHPFTICIAICVESWNGLWSTHEMSALMIYCRIGDKSKLHLIFTTIFSVLYHTFAEQG